MSNRVFGCRLFALPCDRRSARGPKRPFCVFCNPDPSQSNEPRHSGTCICSRGTSHVPIMSNRLFGRHALNRSLTALSLTRSSPCGPTRLFCAFFYATSKQFWRSAESRNVFLLPAHVPPMDDVAPCIEPFSYRFVVDQELTMWSKIVENVHFVPFFTPHLEAVYETAESWYVFYCPDTSCNLII